MEPQTHTHIHTHTHYTHTHTHTHTLHTQTHTHKLFLYMSVWMSSVIHTHLDVTRQYSCSGLEHLDITKQYNCSGLEHLDVTRQYNCLGQVHLDITRQHNCLGPEHLDITRQHICLGPEHLDITRQYNCLGPEHLDVTGQYNCLGLEHLDVTRQYNCLRPEHLDITRIILTPLGSTAAQDCMDQKMSFLSPPPSPKKNCTPFGNATHIRIFFFLLQICFPAEDRISPSEICSQNSEIRGNEEEFYALIIVKQFWTHLWTTGFCCCFPGVTPAVFSCWPFKW